MRIREILLFSAVAIAALPAMAQPQKKPLADAPGMQDPPLFTRMPNYYLAARDAVVERPFDGFDFPITKNGKRDKQRVEGHMVTYKYEYEVSAGPVPSHLQILRNYQAAAAKIGGKTMWEGPIQTTIAVTRGGKETWAFLEAYYQGRAYKLIVIEKQEMQQDVAANADSMRDGLTQNGHAEVPGIFFDFGKSEVKPESEPSLQELAKMLKGAPATKVWVVGHTDNVGSAESNVTLSNARAAAVVAYLTQKLGVESRRLSPHGAGPFAPVASNATDAGRAQNRRVEVVAQP